jgi:3-hydroxyisobutyrate dehydrogenase-like beta-hydroxyacid dehydrogenase
MADGTRTEKLGYLGLGMMGFPMSRRLVKAGHDVTVWNRSPGKAAALVEAGAKTAGQPRGVADAASIIFVCLTDAAAVEEVVFGPEGLATMAGTGKLVVDFSSIHPDAARAMATRLAVNAGIDARRLPEALAGGFADSIPLQLFVPRMAQGIHSPPLGHIATMLKDLDTVIDVARDTSSPVPMAALAAQLFRLAKSARGADADALEIYKLSDIRMAEG